MMNVFLSNNFNLKYSFPHNEEDIQFVQLLYQHVKIVLLNKCRKQKSFVI